MVKKIPTVFKRVFERHTVVDITEEFSSDLVREAFLRGVATIKWDGACCAIIDENFYKRYDAKRGRRPPVGAISCSAPDPVTGHHPYWVLVDENNPADKWFVAARMATEGSLLRDGTYEATMIFLLLLSRSGIRNASSLKSTRVNLVRTDGISILINGW